MKLSFRSAKISDLEVLCDIERLCFTSDRLSRASFRHFIGSDKSDLILAFSQNRLAGYFLILYRKGSNRARLYSIAVHPDFRGQGLGERLLNSMENHVKRRGKVYLQLEVRPDNRRAIDLYLTHGYHQTRMKPRFYEDASDALCLIKEV